MKQEELTKLLSEQIEEYLKEDSDQRAFFGGICDGTKTQLKEMIGISPSTLAIMGKNEYVAMSVLDRICNALDCSISDVIEHTKDEEEKTNDI